ncbi:AP-5 complex subunit mu [Hibiscus syriacus]|uniref:AP-5 complex subunit mu n=1 Tax=Hibiscus syriacus TaxID=106335 RepID=A0A6A2ZXN2_HIBSY|nr:AP-5 complex subunit mu [Hibiscus syriacus]
MAGDCSIRALWILNNLDAVVFSRRFPVVEKRWLAACQSENDSSENDPVKCTVFSSLPSDSDLAAAFSDRKTREGSVRGFGIRVSQSKEGSDSWVDDPITRHLVGFYINREEEGEKNFMWPLALHIKGPYCILILPLVEPRHVKAYARLCKRSDCGNAVMADENLSSLLLDLPSITGAFMVAHAIGDIVTGDVAEPEVVVSQSPSVGGLLDSLTGSIGISGISRAKPVVAPVASSAPSGSTAIGAIAPDVPKTGSRLLDKDALRTFISSAMPFGTPLDLSYSNIFSIKANGFSSLDIPPQDLKQPAWKPYLYRGKQRLLFTIHETLHAAMYDRDEIPDSLSVSGQINCRAELEGLPDVSFPLTGVSTSKIETLSFHPCAQVPEQNVDKQALMFSPPLGNFVLMRYQATCSLGPPVKGFYQLSMVSEDEGAFLFKLHLMEDGSPSIGTVSHAEHSVEWKIITSGRGLSGKSIEATFSGTVRFAPWQTQRSASFRSVLEGTTDDDSDNETENANNMVNVEDFLEEKMNKDLPPVDLEEPFSWLAYNYAKVSFKIVGASLSGISIDPKSVRAPVRKNGVTVIIFNIPESFHYQGLWLFFDKYGEVVDSFIPNKRSKGGSRFGFVRFTRLEDARKAIKCIDSSRIQSNKSRARVVKEVSHTEAPFVGSVDESKLSTLKNSLVDWCRIFIKWVESSSLEEAIASPLSKVGELVGVSPVKFPELEVCVEEAGRNVNSSEVQCPEWCLRKKKMLSVVWGVGLEVASCRGTVHSQIEEVGEHETELVHAEREAVDVYKDRCLSARGYEGSNDYFSDFPMLDGRVESKVVEDVLKEGLINNSAFNRLNGEAMLNRGTKEVEHEILLVFEGSRNRVKEGNYNNFTSLHSFHDKNLAPQRKNYHCRSKFKQNKVQREDSAGRFLYDLEYPALGQNLKKVETDSLMLRKDLDFESGGSVVVLFPDDYGSGSFGR